MTEQLIHAPQAKAISQLKESLSPKTIVSELNRFIVGQDAAKKAVAIALRDRYRRKAVDPSLRSEIIPKNILMVGPTGVGKTEISRRLAKLAGSPFTKIEATKFTEVGYVGRDVESIVRDLMEIGVSMVKDQNKNLHTEKAKTNTEARLLEALVGASPSDETKEKFMEQLLSGQMDGKEIEIKVKEVPANVGDQFFDVPNMPGNKAAVFNVSEMMGKLFSDGADKMKKKKMTVKEAKKTVFEEELERLSDKEALIDEAKDLVENDGIVFIDEIDKIALKRDSSKNSDISREGVQRDLLPLIEGTSVTTKYGPIKTDHVLFIASGAFHMSKPADLLPELQGRLPIRVELSDLSKDDMVRILKEPEASLLKQYTALLGTEGIQLDFTDEAVDCIAEVSTHINKEVENIGARRLHTILEKLLEEISFTAPEAKKGKLTIDKDYVNERLSKLTKQLDLAKFIL